MHVLRRYGVFVQVTSDASRYQRGTARVHGTVDRALLRKWAKSGDPADYYKALLAVSAQAGAQIIDGIHIRSAYGIYVAISNKIFDTPIRRGYTS